LLAATQTRAETGARAGAEFADACRDIGAGTLDCVLPCARVVATQIKEKRKRTGQGEGLGTCFTLD